MVKGKAGRHGAYQLPNLKAVLDDDAMDEVFDNILSPTEPVSRVSNQDNINTDVDVKSNTPVSILAQDDRNADSKSENKNATTLADQKRKTIAEKGRGVPRIKKTEQAKQSSTQNLETVKVAKESRSPQKKTISHTKPKSTSESQHRAKPTLSNEIIERVQQRIVPAGYIRNRHRDETKTERVQLTFRPSTYARFDALAEHHQIKQSKNEVARILINLYSELLLDDQGEIHSEAIPEEYFFSDKYKETKTRRFLLLLTPTEKNKLEELSKTIQQATGIVKSSVNETMNAIIDILVL